MSHYHRLLQDVRRIRRQGDVIGDDQARDIATLWQSPAARSRGITALASSGARLASLRSEVERELLGASAASDRPLLWALLAWIAAHPVDIILYQQVIYLQGDDADEVMGIIYPEWSEGSTGWPDGVQAALDHLRGWDYGEPIAPEAESYERPGSYGSHQHETDEYLMDWHVGLGHVSLYRKIKEVG